MALMSGGGPPPKYSTEFKALMREVKLKESVENVKIQTIVVESLDVIDYEKGLNTEDNDLEFLGHDLKLGSFDDDSYRIETRKIYDICSECKSETMYDEQSDEFYCPACYTEDKSFLHKILKVVR